jgi:hypothetical protein
MSTPRRKLRWLQFSLRSLLVLTMLLAAYLGGWMSNEWRHRRKPPPIPPPRIIFQPVYQPRWAPKATDPEAIERGMKADELEMRRRFPPPRL